MQDRGELPIDVSRETILRLVEYEKLVREWTTRINLVAPSTLDHLWNRHIVDSAQLLSVAPQTEKWVDLGTGGGFPGVVIAILQEELSADTQFKLIESDARKCVFLKTVARKLGLTFEVINRRIEQAEPQNASVVSARALAPMEKLLGFASRHLSMDGTALFLKGTNWQKERDQAKLKWRFDCDVIQSITDSDAAMLKIENIKRI